MVKNVTRRLKMNQHIFGTNRTSELEIQMMRNQNVYLAGIQFANFYVKYDFELFIF